MDEQEKVEKAAQLSMFPDLTPPQKTSSRKPNKLTLDVETSMAPNQGEVQVIEGIAPLILPTRWEYLQPKLGNDKISLRTIIRPIPKPMIVIRNIVQYLKTTDGCQVLVIRADTGSGKTTFLNTLPHYMQDVLFNTQTIDINHIN